MVQTDLPVTLKDSIDKLFAEYIPLNEPIKECFYREKYENNNINPQYYLGKEFLFNKSVVDGCEYQKLFHIIPRTLSYRAELEDFLLQKEFKLKGEEASGCFIYPKEGFMSWHTNFKRNDWRIYIVKSLEGDSFFRYVKDGEIITENDPKGWSYRIFYVGDADNPYWHCVYGGSGRYSIGFRLQRK
jgi:hypothetical protein